MAQIDTMPPPTSSKEPRRSGRRSHPSTSTSKSSGSPSPDTTVSTTQKGFDSAVRFSSSSSARQKRVKDDGEVNAEEPQMKIMPPGSAKTSSSSKRSQRKGKEKLSKTELYNGTDATRRIQGVLQDVVADNFEEDEDAGITRCICEGRADDDADAGEFMIQCEICKVWQHGFCMGFPSEDQAPQGDYYCEECKPEEHVELLKRLNKRQRQGSAQSHHTLHGTSRTSRSHSPSHLLKPAKRRNTMNSRDAAYEESLLQVLGASAAEAAALAEETIKEQPDTSYDIPDDINDSTKGRKRKRSDGEQANTKRKRSVSTSPEDSRRSIIGETGEEQESIPKEPTDQFAPPPLLKSNSGRSKRGGGRKAAADTALGEPDEGAALKKHPNQYTYRAANNTHDHGTRRNAGGAGSTSNSTIGTGLNAASATVNSLSRNPYYTSTQQHPLFTSWNLPDYLAHLQSLLPSETPTPLVIYSQMSSTDSDSTSTERGVRVKWPAKRMSVADMNKRVRALVEWVGREQASALERVKRRQALWKAKSAEMGNIDYTNHTLMADIEEPSSNSGQRDVEGYLNSVTARDTFSNITAEEAKPIEGILTQSTETMMEELMEELISFQERFGPGAKGRIKERSVRAAISS